MWAVVRGVQQWEEVGVTVQAQRVHNLKKWVIFAISSDLGVSSRNLSLLILCGGLQRVKAASQGLRGTPGARFLKKGAMVHKGGLLHWALKVYRAARE